MYIREADRAIIMHETPGLERSTCMECGKTPYIAFVRMVRLPVPVAQDKIKASFKNGVLTISLPKTEEAKQKAIPVNVE
jgi:hypothetical protein